ncbi:putative Hsp70 family chaperone Lhs1/Orp150 [Piedraia hortae CBS 480.64]|uniref:Putative Hsp70 family chaperone Lhs1/Orp150 n=1 Tax=Piedraia hortae CBS 480.64 TaxID=1314780 RepID=A0A6A7C761_9PEZI|nr:putative Hsp70 family chaperone Lhs1/Orp150 [Piedraia hortae CBS 480.64]
MNLPGRLPLSALLLFFFFAASNAASSVIGLDFGTLNLKAVLVKPGIPLEIVLTRDSKRKEVSAVAFKPIRDAGNKIVLEPGTFPEREYGSNALALQGRLPGDVFPNLKPLLGVPWNGGSDVLATYTERYPALQTAQPDSGSSIAFKSAAFVANESVWSVEELLAMELANIKRNAELMAGSGQNVGDVVIAVPPFYTANERRAIETAASLAGLEVNALISDGLAVGLDYAKSRNFPEVTKGQKPEYHLVFDMGAGSTTATLLRFQSRSVKDVGRFNKTVQEVAVLGTGWDRQLGGDGLNQAIVDEYLRVLLEKPEVKSLGTQLGDIKTNGRVMSRLWKEAEKARQVLSANAETRSSFEELLPDLDFAMKLTRADFEKLAETQLSRVTNPVETALAAAKMSISEVDSIILHGGCVRTPYVQRKLEQLAGSAAKLRTNVNADESSVFGAAFKGAGLSPSFRVRAIRDSDIAGYASGIIYSDGGKERKQQLFTPMSTVGNGAITKQVTFRHKDDFTFDLYQLVDEVEQRIASIQSGNLTESVKELKSKFGCEKDEVSTKFNIKLGAVEALPEIVSATVSCETNSTSKGGSVGNAVKNLFGLKGNKGQEPLADKEDEGPVEEVYASSTSTSQSSTTSTKAAEPTTRTETIPILLTVSPHGALHLPREVFQLKRSRLIAFDRSDHARYSRDEALNVLESYVYFVRDFLANKDYHTVSTSSMRDEIGKLLSSVSSFLEDHEQVGKASEGAFKDKKSELRKLVEPIISRRKEETARPEAINALRRSLGQLSQFIDVMKGEVETASEAASPPAAKDGLEDLEEADKSSSAPAVETDAPAYSKADLESLESVLESTKKWLEEKEDEQGKLKPWDNPALSTQDIEGRAKKLADAMKEMVSKMEKKQKKAQSKKAKSAKPSGKGKTDQQEGAAHAHGHGDEHDQSHDQTSQHDHSHGDSDHDEL